MVGNVIYDKKDDKVILKISGEFDSRLVGRFENLVEELLKLGETTFVIDLSACNFIYSVGIGKIVSLSKRLSAVGGSISILNPQPRIKKLIHLVKLNHLLVDDEGTF